jgi:hypothetical protein
MRLRTLRQVASAVWLSLFACGVQALLPYLISFETIVAARAGAGIVFDTCPLARSDRVPAKPGDADKPSNHATDACPLCLALSVHAAFVGPLPAPPPLPSVAAIRLPRATATVVSLTTPAPGYRSRAPPFASA